MDRLESGYAAISPAAAAKPVLIIDSGVTDADILIEDLGQDVDILLLAPGRSGLGQIADYMADRRDIPSLHILSHGKPGALVLAGSRIDLAALVLSHNTLQTIAASLSVNADVVLYGCSVLAGPKGSSFARFLSVALEAHVSGSLMPVGSLALGGDWILRDTQGDWVEPIFTPQARAVYPNLLTGPGIVGTTGDDVLSGTAAAAGISGQAGDDTLSGGDPQSDGFAVS